MEQELRIYNSLTRNKDFFKPLHPPYVGMFVCGPVLTANAHIGSYRTLIDFDIVFRYLQHIGYKVRYVRGITDSAHLEADDEDNLKNSRLERFQPMELVQKYTLDFHKVMGLFNILPPTIEPTSTGHILEQIKMTQQIIDNGYAYVNDGTVYFDVSKYNQVKPYGILTNMNLEDFTKETNTSYQQTQKKNVLDFALWIKAEPQHLMQWPSQWGMGFPGWHIDCSVVSTKYLGEQFDIHGGSKDLLHIHHTNEIAQNNACYNKSPANYWMHTEMLTVNGVKMGRTYGNSFLPSELFSGNHPLLERGFDPMIIRFFILQTNYKSKTDFSNQGLQAAEKGYQRLMASLKLIPQLETSAKSSFSLDSLRQGLYKAMNDDFNTPVVIAELFDCARIINSINDGNDCITETDRDGLKTLYDDFVFSILGLSDSSNDDSEKVKSLTNLILKMRSEVRQKKDFAKSDEIRDELSKIGITVSDKSNIVSWKLETDLESESQSKYTIVDIPENFRGVFQDFLLGFENYCKLKGQSIRISMDNSRPNKIGFIVSIKDPSKIQNWQLDKNWKEFIEKVSNRDSFGSMPEIIPKREHNIEKAKLQRRVKFLEGEFHAFKNQYEIFKSAFKALQTKGFQTSIDEITPTVKNHLKLFVSYSKHDEEDLQDFEDHLVTLKEEGLVTFNCRQIEFGKEWDQEIKKQIDECDILICLVSVKFLNTDYIRIVEIPRAIEQNKIILPIIIKACDWETSVLGKYQAAQRGRIVSLDNNLMLLGKIKSQTSDEKAAFWTSIIKEFRSKLLPKISHT